MRVGRIESSNETYILSYVKWIDNWKLLSSTRGSKQNSDNLELGMEWGVGVGAGGSRGRGYIYIYIYLWLILDVVKVLASRDQMANIC